MYDRRGAVVMIFKMSASSRVIVSLEAPARVSALSRVYSRTCDRQCAVTRLKGFAYIRAVVSTEGDQPRVFLDRSRRCGRGATSRYISAIVHSWILLSRA